MSLEKGDGVTAGGNADLEQQAADEAEALREFNAGFEESPTESTPPARVEDGKTDDGQKSDTTEGSAASTAAAEVKYRQVTEAEWNDLMVKAAALDELRTDSTKKFDTAFGKVGGLQRAIDDIRKQMEAGGGSVEITPEDVSDIAEEFPDMGERVLKTLTKVSKKLKGTGSPSLSLDDEAFSKAVAATVNRALLEDLEDPDAYPNWREIVGQKDSSTEYRKWLGTQPAGYQERLNSTNSPLVIKRSLDKFTKSAAEAKRAAEEKAKADAEALKQKNTNDRRNRLDAAVIQQGTGGSAPAGTPPEDEFEAGFKNG